MKKIGEKYWSRKISSGKNLVTCKKFSYFSPTFFSPIRICLPIVLAFFVFYYHYRYCNHVALLDIYSKWFLIFFIFIVVRNGFRKANMLYVNFTTVDGLWNPETSFVLIILRKDKIKTVVIILKILANFIVHLNF